MPVPTTTASIATPLHRDRAYEEIRSWILAGICTPGERLNPREIQQQLGTSIQPVGLALDRLSMQGLVVIHPHRDTSVVRPSHEDGVEAAAALRWVANALPADSQLTRDAISALEDLDEAGGQGPFDTARAAFDAVCQAAGNRVLAEALQRDLDRMLYTAQFAQPVVAPAAG